MCQIAVMWFGFHSIPRAAASRPDGDRRSFCLPALITSEQVLPSLCPITSQIKGYPFEVALPPDNQIQGVILCDQIKSLDWRVRRADFVEAVPEKVVIEVQQKLRTLLGL